MSADIPETGQPSRADSKKTHAEELMLRDRLKILGEKHDCDKFTVHRFEQVYSQHLGVFAHRTQFKLLEIGVGGEDKTPGGASLRVWSEAFPNAEIHGVDIYDKSDLVIERCTLHQIDQSNQAALIELASKHGPFDVIIDDGSHKANDSLSALFVLAHYLTDGGLYIIEDVQTSYWPHYGGSSLAIDLFDTPMKWIKHVCDIVQRNEILTNDGTAASSGFRFCSLHVYPNIVVMEAGDVPPSSVLNSEIKKTWVALESRIASDLAPLWKKMSEDSKFRLEMLNVIRLFGSIKF